MEHRKNYIVVFGVAGSGKTLISKMLSEKLAIEFIEGDDLHPVANIEKMSSGYPLNDADRVPWLKIIKKTMAEHIDNDCSFVLSCSALKLSYRDILRQAGVIQFLFLDVAENLILERLTRRKNHFMPSSLLHSQMEVLERPKIDETDVSIINASQKPEEVLSDCLKNI